MSEIYFFARSEIRASSDPRENPRLDSRRIRKENWKKRNPEYRKIVQVWGILMDGSEREGGREKRGPFVI